MNSAVDRLAELARLYAKQYFDLECNLRDELWRELDRSLHEFNHSNEPRQMYWNGYSTAIRHVIEFINRAKLSSEPGNNNGSDDPRGDLQRQPEGSSVPHQCSVAQDSGTAGVDQGTEQEDGVEVRAEQVPGRAGDGAGQGSADGHGFVPFNADDQ